MIKRTHLLLIFSLLIAGFLTFYKIPVASSQGVTVRAALVEGELPLQDPGAELWLESSAVQVPLSAQNIAKPYLTGVGDRTMTVRALHNQTQIAILVEWEDATQNDQMVRVQDFRDAVAVQFPLVEGQPFFCMGQQGGNVNIWHWKADWQADLVARQDVDTVYPNMSVDEYTFADPEAGKSAGVGDYEDVNYVPALAAGNLFASPSYASPVEDLIAGGFGTITSQPQEGQNVQGYGVWQEGKWRVIFSRELASPEETDISFSPGQVYPMALAVWDGENQERNGQKSTSQWVSLQLEGESAPAAVTTPAEQPATEGVSVIFWVITGVLVLLVIVATIVYFRLPDGDQT